MLRFMMVRDDVLTPAHLEELERAGRESIGAEPRVQIGAYPSMTFGAAWRWIDERLTPVVERLIGVPLLPCWEGQSYRGDYAPYRYCETARTFTEGEGYKIREARLANGHYDRVRTKVRGAVATHIAPRTEFAIRIEAPPEPSVVPLLGLCAGNLRITFNAGRTWQRRDDGSFETSPEGRTVYYRGRPMAQIFGFHQIVILRDVLDTSRWSDNLSMDTLFGSIAEHLVPLTRLPLRASCAKRISVRFTHNTRVSLLDVPEGTVAGDLLQYERGPAMSETPFRVGVWVNGQRRDWFSSIKEGDDVVITRLA